MQGRYEVLSLCTGNSARSLMAEAIMNKKGFPTLTAHSAGSHAMGRVHPQGLRQLEFPKLPTEGLRSKDWDEFAEPGAPELHFVFAVCDNAAKEVCFAGLFAICTRGLKRFLQAHDLEQNRES